MNTPRRIVSTAALLAACVASVATSQPSWDWYAESEPVVVALDETAPVATYEVTVSAYALDGWVDWADLSVSLDLAHGFVDAPVTEPETETVEPPAGSEGESCEEIDDTGDVATDCDIEPHESPRPEQVSPVRVLATLTPAGVDAQSEGPRDGAEVLELRRGQSTHSVYSDLDLTGEYEEQTRTFLLTLELDSDLEGSWVEGQATGWASFSADIDSAPMEFDASVSIEQID